MRYPRCILDAPLWGVKIGKPFHTAYRVIPCHLPLLAAKSASYAEALPLLCPFCAYYAFLYWFYCKAKALNAQIMCGRLCEW